MSMQLLSPTDDFSSGQPSPDAPLRRKACIGCKTRKVKCNKESPCKNCTEWKIECTYPSPVRKCRRRPRNSSNTKAEQGDHVTESPESLNARMRKLETVVQDLTKLIESERRGFQALLAAQANPAQSQSPSAGDGYDSGVKTPSSNHSSTGSGMQASRGSSRNLSVNTDKYESTENGMRTPASNNSSGYSTSSTIQSTFPKQSLGNPFMDLAAVRPTPSQAQYCFQAFLDKVDPLVKIVHKPSLEAIILRRTYNEEALTKGEDALLLTICFTAAITMSDSEVEGCFKMPKNAALITRRCAVEQALLESDPSTIEELAMLQAFVLYLSFNRFMDSTKLTWAICALAKCISSSLQLGSYSAFDSEMEKRLWWQLWYLDQRAAEDHGLTPSMEIDFCPSLPLNINDRDLIPDTDLLPVPRVEWTEMSFCLMRFEIAKASEQIGGLFPHYHGLHDNEPSLLPAKESTIKTCHRTIQSTFIRYCVGSEPIHWLARHVARVLVAELWFKLYGSLKPSPQTEGTHIRLVQMASDIVDIPKLLKEDAKARQWSWLLDAYIHFLPLAFILTESCQLPSSEIMDRAWTVAEAGFTRWSGDIKISKNGEILSVLMAKARAYKEGKQQPQIPKAFMGSATNATMSGSTSLAGVADNPYMVNPYYENLGGEFSDLSFVLDNSALNNFNFQIAGQGPMHAGNMYQDVNPGDYLANPGYEMLDYNAFDQTVPGIKFPEAR
ncbi:hypothetical protein BU16DRAFT_521162 [Lophium mytilinum]|uniref:Zn(2)-C6 fungal-type domain-containing protein n=1 Tax=Lophium mytilinum TaxID=390894 RepID=A0A6A6RCA8_9PEZI|nr:hypothetical protein BU16DRAFT_521162 [Lophium mytilinum]